MYFVSIIISSWFILPFLSFSTSYPPTTILFASHFDLISISIGFIFFTFPTKPAIF